jgi:plasmid stabilization system protein ParE
MQPTPYRVVISPDVYNQLNRIFDQIRRDSPANAVRMVTEITDAMESLANFPHCYAVLKGKRASSKFARLMPVAPYVVYYRIIERLHAVE